MTRRAPLTLSLAVTLLAPGLVASSDSNENPFSLEFSSGFEYDSTVAVLDLDQSTGASDVAALIDLGLGFDKRLTERFKVKAGYDFSQSLHDQFGEFDIRIHRGSGGVEHDFGPFKAGLDFQYADAALDDDDYLVLKRASPSLSRLFGKRLFLRLAYARSDKEFTTSPGRDATTDSPSIDAFVFLDGVKSYLLFGYQHLDEDALDAQFDFTGAKAKVQLSRRLSPGRRAVTLKTALRYEARDYDDPSSAGGEPREDRRYRFETELELMLTKRGFFRAGYEYADNRSNLASVDFDEHVATLGFGAKL